METETKTLTFDPTNLSGPQDGKYASEWTKYTEIEGTDCAPSKPKGNLGSQFIEPTQVCAWENGYTIVSSAARVGNVNLDTSRGTQAADDQWHETEKVGVLDQEVRVHRVTSVNQRRVRKGVGYVVRHLDITLEGGDKVTLELFGEDVASVTINAKKKEVK